jgi:hypothetical protein
MLMPGFGAELSLYKATTCYRTGTLTMERGVIPQDIRLDVNLCTYGPCLPHWKPTGAPWVKQVIIGYNRIRCCPISGCVPIGCQEKCSEWKDDWLNWCNEIGGSGCDNTANTLYDQCLINGRGPFPPPDPTLFI